MSGMGRGIDAMKEEANKINGTVELSIHESGSDLTLTVHRYL
jgi:hypothetical protein